MSLAHRASTIYQPGDARKQARDLESCDTLIRCLPPNSSDMVRKVHGELCTELGRPCSATDLSRALHNLRHSIDADIKLHGVSGESRNKNKYPIKSHNRGKVNSYSSYGINTAPSRHLPPLRRCGQMHYPQGEDNDLHLDLEESSHLLHLRLPEEDLEEEPQEEVLDDK